MVFLVVQEEAGIDQFVHVALIGRLVDISSRVVDVLGDVDNIAQVLNQVAMNVGGGLECLPAFEKADNIDRLRRAAEVVDGEVLRWQGRAKVLVLILVWHPTDSN